jgi:hypothetical protein
MPATRLCRGKAAPAAIMALVVVALMAMTGSAFAIAPPKVNIVTQGEVPSGTPPRNTHYFKTIQAAVNASVKNDWVLIEAGKYAEEVKVTTEHSGIYIRGMDRNGVIVDGESISTPEGRNGIEIYKANNVWIENLTVRNFDKPSTDGPGGNEIWWNGGAGSGKIGAHGWFGRYLTAYDTGLNGGYGIFTSNEQNGWWENIYASGFNDSGMYLGACRECKARITKATIENNAVGYSGSNGGGKLVIEESTFRHNTTGIAPNSENPGDGPPPQNGSCVGASEGLRSTPFFTSTNIAHCTIIRNNLVTENDNLSVPANNSTAASPWGIGVILPGDYGDLVENNTITNNPINGVLGFEYPNPFPPTEQTIYFELAGNKIANNKFANNGYAEPTSKFAGDITLDGGLFGKRKSQSTNNCVSGNTLADATFPAKIEEGWGCQNTTTPNPEGGFAAIEYLLGLQATSQSREPVPQPAPPAQPSMPNACEGVPTNPLCP